MGTFLLDLSDDILLFVIQHLQVEGILSIRQTCRRLNDLTRYRSIWLDACNRFVIVQCLPFPYKHLDDVDTIELERWTRRAILLRNSWIRNDRRPCRTISFVGGPLNGLLSVRFVLKRGHEWIITVSDGIWPVIACWDLQRVKNGGPTKVGEWLCGGGATIKDVAVDFNLSTDACIAVSVDNYSRRKRYVEIQRIVPIPGIHGVAFETIKVIDTSFSPASLDGDILVISDEYSETRVMNWRTGEYAILKGSEGADDVIQHNKCLQVYFGHQSIFVARSRSIDLFPEVVLRSPDEVIEAVQPLKTCTFGWIDGIAMAPLSYYLPEYSYPPIAILVRAEQGDPWVSDIHSVKYYLVSPDPTFNPSEDSSTGSTSPYIFPPVYLSSIFAKRDFMRCPTLALGPAGTSVWVGGINSGRTQELWSMIWPGPLRNSTEPGHFLFSKLLAAEGSGGGMWTSMDYIESRGCIALGAVDGLVTVLYMVE